MISPVFFRNERDGMAMFRQTHGFFNLSAIGRMQPVGAAHGSDDEIVGLFCHVGLRDAAAILDLEFMIGAGAHNEFSCEAEVLIPEEDGRGWHRERECGGAVCTITSVLRMAHNLSEQLEQINAFLLIDDSIFKDLIDSGD